MERNHNVRERQPTISTQRASLFPKPNEPKIYSDIDYFIRFFVVVTLTLSHSLSCFSSCCCCFFFHFLVWTHPLYVRIAFGSVYIQENALKQLTHGPNQQKRRWRKRQLSYYMYYWLLLTWVFFAVGVACCWKVSERLLHFTSQTMKKKLKLSLWIK